MNKKFKLPKIANILMLVMLVTSICAPTVYDASEITKEAISQTSSVEERELSTEVDSEISKSELETNEQDSKKSSEENKVESNAPPKKDENSNKVDTAKADKSAVVDLTGLSKDEIAKLLDPNVKEQNYITLDPQSLRQVRGVNITEVKSSEDFSVINSTMYGEWGVYRANGHFIFCIQPGADVLSTADTTSASGSKYSHFSTTSKIYIGHVISSAMDHYNTSKNTDWVFAGQLLIWEYLSAHEADVIGNPMESWNPGYLDGWTIHNSAKYGSEINTIENEISAWNTLPSFMGPQVNPKKHTLKYNAASDNFSVTLKDTNGVWDSKFANYGNFGNYTVTNPAGANNVKVTTSVESTSYTAAKTYTWKPYASGTSEFYDAGQDLLYVGSDPVKGFMKFNTVTRPLGGISAKKVDAETGKALAGAEFKIYKDINNNDAIDTGDTVVTTVKSNSKGIMSTGKTLLAGNYTAKESKAPAGYIKSNKVYSLHVNANEITDYTSTPWKNSIIKGGFALTKLGEIYNLEPQALEGIEFTVTSSTYPGFKKVYTTDKNGNIITPANELKYGSYHIEETKAPSKYVIDFKQDFKISKNGVVVQLNGGNDIINELYMNRVHGVKMAQNFNNSDDTLYPLAGAKFGIYEDIGDANGTIDRQDIMIDLEETDENGEFTSVELSEGSYYAKEVEAPAGYNLNTEAYPFTVKNDGTLEDGSIQDLGEIRNEVITGTATLTKVGSRECDKSLAKPGEIKSCQKPLDNVSFAIYPDINGDGEWGKGEDKPLQVITTDAEGIATTDTLKYGTYFAREVNNPRDNYLMNNNVFTFSITNQDEVVKINNGVAIENIEKLGKITISKTGESLDNLDDATVAVAGAEYTIYDADSKKVETITTNEEGIANSSLLPFGEYTFKETKAPIGYALDENIYDFTIDNETYQSPISFDLTDDILTSNIVLTKVDSVTRKHLEGAEFEVLTKDESGKYVNYNKEGTNFVTDKNGYINLENTPYGEYALKEIKAPNGYIINDKLIPFEVNKDGATIKLTFANTAEVLATTGSIVGKLIVILSIVLIVLLVIRRKTKKELD